MKFVKFTQNLQKKEEKKVKMELPVIKEKKEIKKNPFDTEKTILEIKKKIELMLEKRAEIYERFKDKLYQNAYKRITNEIRTYVEKNGDEEIVLFVKETVRRQLQEEDERITVIANTKVIDRLKKDIVNSQVCLQADDNYCSLECSVLWKDGYVERLESSKT